MSDKEATFLLHFHSFRVPLRIPVVLFNWFGFSIFLLPHVVSFRELKLNFFPLCCSFLTFRESKQLITSQELLPFPSFYSNAGSTLHTDYFSKWKATLKLSFSKIKKIIELFNESSANETRRHLASAIQPIETKGNPLRRTIACLFLPPNLNRMLRSVSFPMTKLRFSCK